MVRNSAARDTRRSWRTLRVLVKVPVLVLKFYILLLISVFYESLRPFVSNACAQIYVYKKSMFYPSFYHGNFCVLLSFCLFFLSFFFLCDCIAFDCPLLNLAPPSDSLSHCNLQCNFQSDVAPEESRRNISRAQ